VWGARSVQAPGILKELCGYATLLFADDRDIELMLGSSATTATAFEQFPSLRWIARTQRRVHSVEKQLYSGEFVSRSVQLKSREYDLSGIVERIGAGDAFAAGALHRLLVDESDVHAVIEFATAAACYKHSLPGDACIATVAEIDALLGERTADIKR
jgi:2-dehydro-3-deoxygluconokinase